MPPIGWSSTCFGASDIRKARALHALRGLWRVESKSIPDSKELMEGLRLEPAVLEEISKVSSLRIPTSCRESVGCRPLQR